MSNLILNLHSQRCWQRVPFCWGFPSHLAPLFFVNMEFIMHCNFDYLMKKKCISSPLWHHGLLYICALLRGKGNDSWLCSLEKIQDFLCRLHSEVSKWCLVGRWKKLKRTGGELSSNSWCLMSVEKKDLCNWMCCILFLGFPSEVPACSCRALLLSLPDSPPGLSACWGSALVHELRSCEPHSPDLP